MEQTTLPSQNSPDIDNLQANNANTRRLFTAYYTLPYTSTGNRRALLVETSTFEPDGLFIGVEKNNDPRDVSGVHLNTEQLVHLVQVVSEHCGIQQLTKSAEDYIDTLQCDFNDACTDRDAYKQAYDKLSTELHDAQVKIANLEEENNRPANRQIADLKEIIKTLLEY